MLKPSGVFLFSEPMDMNPVGRLVRRLTPEARTVDERPFQIYELNKLREHFTWEFKFDGFLTVPIGAIGATVGLQPQNMLGRLAHLVDKRIASAPGLKYWCRYVIISGTPKSA